MSDQNLKSFITDLDKPAIDFWRETLTMVRQLHNDVWNGVRFFFALNAIIFAGFAALMRGNMHTYHHLLILLILPAFGVALSHVGRKVLRSHRKYYLDMLTRKSFIEKELGFYDRVLYEDDKYRFDLSFPWSVVDRRVVLASIS
ncbi:hypothetical protein [Desulfobacula sp.]|uniref:RipA family octameric membrane protein n=1 Tax=Desulfobacula sp. TaxID=2593537 RepID=UPI0026145771|nr:hypothetical protein [Desulfobacula sp.]